MKEPVRCYNCSKGKLKEPHINKGKWEMLEWIYKYMQYQSIYEAITNYIPLDTINVHFNGQEYKKWATEINSPFLMFNFETGSR